MTKPPQYQMFYGDASNMKTIRTAEVDLIMTGPPYFSEATEKILKKPVSEQNEIERVRSELTAFAMSLRPVYVEMDRILKPDGVIVLQIKDIRYGRALIGCSELHRQMLESIGFNLITRMYWHKKGKRLPALRFRDKLVVGAFRADDVEDVMVFARTDIPVLKNVRVDLSKAEIDKCWRSPLWDMAPAGTKRKHPHQSPDTLIKRIVALYSREGDLVVDPFAGGGTTLKIAVAMGRQAIGYEIKENYVKTADQVARSSLSAVKRKPEDG